LLVVRGCPAAPPAAALLLPLLLPPAAPAPTAAFLGGAAGTARGASPGRSTTRLTVSTLLAPRSLVTRSVTVYVPGRRRALAEAPSSTTT
jgi:hypothetical protein